MTPLGGGTPPSANTPPPADGPNVQVPPVLQVHVVPEQLQSPEQAAAKVEGLLPPQLRGKVTAMTTIQVAPKDNEETDCDMFSPFGRASGKGPRQPHRMEVPLQLRATLVPARAAAPSCWIAEAWRIYGRWGNTQPGHPCCQMPLMTTPASGGLPKRRAGRRDRRNAVLYVGPVLFGL